MFQIRFALGVLLLFSCAEAQDLLGRFSWRTTSSLPVTTEIEPRVFLEEEGASRMCAVIYDDGSFLVQRAAGRRLPEVFMGTVPRRELRELRRILGSKGFRKLVGRDRYHAEVVKQEFETLHAIVPRRHGVQRFKWIDPDGRSPMPGPAQDLVEWLQQPWQHYGIEAAARLPVCDATLQPAENAPEITLR